MTATQERNLNQQQELNHAKYVIHARSEGNGAGAAQLGAFWSEATGWGSLEAATSFSTIERMDRFLPVSSGGDSEWMLIEEASDLVRGSAPGSQDQLSETANSDARIIARLPDQALFCNEPQDRLDVTSRILTCALIDIHRVRNNSKAASLLVNPRDGDRCGPDDVVLERAVCAFFGVVTLDSITQTMLDGARQQHGIALPDLYRLWDRLAGIPVTRDGACLETPFLHFAKGAEKEAVWHWFEAQNALFVVGDALQGIRCIEAQRSADTSHLKREASDLVTSARLRCTSINHCKNGNSQIDYAGTRHDCVAHFEQWCVGNDVLWAHLFEERTGNGVACFNNVQGLTTLV